MLENVQLQDVLVLDIETVSQQAQFADLDADWQELWAKKSAHLQHADDNPALMYDRAAIYAEFGKIICIGLGIYHVIDGQVHLKVKTIHGHDEKAILLEFAELLNKHFNQTEKHKLLAHNGKEFDFPYLSRRLLINGIALPKILDTAGKKPWEIQHLDTMELWKFGDYKSYTSLNVLAKCFGIPSPKEDLDGSLVGPIYWQHKDLERIANYCKKDIITTAQIFMKYKQMDVIPESFIKISE